MKVILLISSLLIGVSIAQRRDRAFEGESRDRFNDFRQEEKPETTTPRVEIKRFVNQQNPDGSYTYGFEGDDGTFRLETRDPNGAVKGKYGFYDANNELKVVEYTAGKGVGFAPQGELIDEAGVKLPENKNEQQPIATFDADGARRSYFAGDPNVFRIETPIHPPRSSAGDAGFTEDGQYIPSIALEGFSEDLDEDGIVDPVPKDGRLPERAERRRPSSAPRPDEFRQAPRPQPRPAPRPQPRPAPRPQPRPAPRPEPVPQLQRPGFSFSFGDSIDGIQRQEIPAPPRREEPQRFAPPPPQQRQEFRPQQFAPPPPQQQLSFAPQPQFRPRAQEDPRARPAPQPTFSGFQPSQSFRPEQRGAVFTASGQPFSGPVGFNPTSSRGPAGRPSAPITPNVRPIANARPLRTDQGLFRTASPDAISPSFAGVPAINPLSLRRQGRF